MEHLKTNDIHIDWCLVGEPSSSERVGDTIKNGRRGSLGAVLTVHGKQGHVAYPHLADNPIHRMTAILNELTGIEWDHGNEFFPATTFQVSNLEAGTGADNVIPQSARAVFNLRYSTELTGDMIKARVLKIINRHAAEHRIEWRHSGHPFLTPPGVLVAACSQAVKSITGYTPSLSTAGGTSDGRFIAPTGAEVVELGVVNASIHKIDEHTDIEQLEQLTEIYTRVLENLLGK
jgi:succinyl-diaminopimelate desuccinylase